MARAFMPEAPGQPDSCCASCCATDDHAGVSLDDGELRRLGNGDIALPALVFQLKRLDGHSVRVGIELRKTLVLRDPAAKDVVGEHFLTGLVVSLDRDVLAKIG